MSNLSQFRNAIDAIDDQIMALLNERSLLVKQVGLTKHSTQEKGIAYMRSGREADVIKRIYAVLKEGVFPAEAAVHIWRMVICASLSLESDFSISVPEGDNTAYCMSREYFGAFTPILQTQNYQQVIANLIEGKAQAGVFSLDNRTEKWWRNLPEDIKIFACLPALITPDTPITTYAVAKLIPEQTGDDTTLLLVQTATIQKVLQKLANSNPLILDSDKPDYLVAVEGYVTQVTSIADSTISVLGSYANPIIIGKSNE